MHNVPNSRVEWATAPAVAECESTTTFVGGFITRAMLVGFANLGLDTEQLCAAAGVPSALLMDNTARVPNDAFWAVWREAQRLSDDPPLLGLQLVKAIPLRAVGGVVGDLISLSETGLDGIRYLTHYRRLCFGRMRADLHEDDGSLTVEFHIGDEDDPAARHVYEMIVGGFWRVLSEATLERLRPLRVSFHHSAPPDVASHERFFGGPVEFRASSNRLRLPLTPLGGPMVAAQPRAASRLRTLLDSELKTIAPEFTVAVAEHVRASLEKLERPTRTSVARRMGMGRRTLQRRLHDEGVSFRRIVEREQRDVALALLRQPEPRVIDIAEAAGFTDPTSFSKAFRRWTGDSPSAYRARALERTD